MYRYPAEAVKALRRWWSILVRTSPGECQDSFFWPSDSRWKHRFPRNSDGASRRGLSDHGLSRTQGLVLVLAYSSNTHVRLPRSTVCSIWAQTICFRLPWGLSPYSLLLWSLEYIPRAIFAMPARSWHREPRRPNTPYEAYYNLFLRDSNTTYPMKAATTAIIKLVTLKI